ncbi:hypothetical protein C8Q75DRAFT_545201 [Abortiporus biennis]|nr:hypothetical protein C8Q75DRAFT_545201 [Abortiporus biennis]
MDRQTSISTIRTLSYFLSNFTTGKPIPRDRNKNGHLSFLNHISTMLNTGTPPSLVLAVTGQISPTNFEAAVVVSSNSNEDDKFQSSYDITKVEPSNMSDESIRNPSSLGKSNGPPFQQHLCDVAGILRLLSQSPDPAELSNRLLFWLIVQCRKRIATRFRLGTKVWTSAPWKVMEDWSPNANDALASPDIDISEPFRKGLSECGFPANGDGVHHWIHCLGKLLSAAHQLRNKNDKASLVKLRSCLTCVETILESSEVKRIFRESSLSEGFKSV